ncbi:BTB/POZ fold [Naviculisporaceae sp. PSN 640]
MFSAEQLAVGETEMNDFSKHFNSGAFSDCQIRCGDRVWNLHKIILCNASKYFEAAFSGSFAEAETNVITLTDQDPDHVDEVLRFIYYGYLPDSLHTKHHDKFINFDMQEFLPYYEKYIWMYMLADYMQLPDLKNEYWGLLDDANDNIRRISSTKIFGPEESETYTNTIERFVGCVTKAYSLPVNTLDIYTSDRSLRRIFVGFFLGCGTHALPRELLERIRDAEPQLLLDLLLAKDSRCDVCDELGCMSRCMSG